MLSEPEVAIFEREDRVNNASYLGEKGAIFVNPSLFF